MKKELVAALVIGLAFVGMMSAEADSDNSHGANAGGYAGGAVTPSDSSNGGNSHGANAGGYAGGAVTPSDSSVNV